MSPTPAGINLPEFTAAQLDFAAHIRNPAVHACPADVPARRMQIYTDLFYNNIENFLSGAFPVARSCLRDEVWHGLVREFFEHHGSSSPYFLQISEEFLVFLQARGLHDLPDFLLELSHYEWVELALDVAVADDGDDDLPAAAFDPTEPLRLSSVAMPLAYRYRVQEIGPDNQPDRPPEHPEYLLVYRNADLDVRFMASNQLTHRLLAVCPGVCADEALRVIAAELQAAGSAVPAQEVRAQGLKIAEHLHGLGILRGAGAIADAAR